MICDVCEDDDKLLLLGDRELELMKTSEAFDVV